MILKNTFLIPLILFGLFLIQCKTDKKESDAMSNIDFCKSIHRNDSLSLSSQLADLDSVMKVKTGVYVLEDGAGAMITRAWLSEYTEESIRHPILYLLYGQCRTYRL